MQRVWCCLSRGKEALRSSLSVSTSRPELNLDASTLLHLLLCRICWGDGACCRCWPWLAASGTSGKRLSSRESWSRQSLRRCVIDMFGACDHPKKIESGGLVTKKGDAPGVIGVCVVFFFVFLLSVSFAISPPVGCRIDWEQLFLARGLRLPACVRGPPRRLRVVNRVQSNERRGAFLTAHLFAPSSLLVVIIRERASLAPHLLTCLSFAGVEAVSKGTEGQKKNQRLSFVRCLIPPKYVRYSLPSRGFGFIFLRRSPSCLVSRFLTRVRQPPTQSLCFRRKR